MIHLIDAHTWLVIISGLVPLVTYVLNHYAPWTDEKVKAFVLVIAAAVTGGLYQAVDSGGFGWNQVTLKYVVVAVFAAFGSHAIIHKPAGWSAALGGGSNAPGPKAAPPAV